VPQATQAGSIYDRWSWVEPSIWTERMLNALEQGVKGGVWFSLIDKVYAPATLRAAWAKVQANRGAAGIDRDHQRWPNAFFTRLGLFSLEHAHTVELQFL